jgi:hypothetical protein
MNLSEDSLKTKVSQQIIKNESVFNGLGLFFAAITGVCAIAWVSGADIEPLAFGMSLVMSLFFALPSIAKKVTEVRPMERMSFEEIIDLVEKSKREEWQTIDEDKTEEVFYLRDPRLRIKHHSGERGVQVRDFKDKWANAFPDEKAMGLWFDLYYDQGILKRILLVAVDGFRAYIPCPNPGTKDIEKFDDNVARITAYQLDMYERYLEKTGLKVIPTSRVTQRR